MKAVDIGAAPGGWSQVLSDKLNFTESDTNVVAVDLLRMNPLKGVEFIHGDINEDSVIEKVSQAFDFEKVDIVVSDAVPDFVGEPLLDHVAA